MFLTRREHVFKEEVSMGFSKDSHCPLSLLRKLSLFVPPTKDPLSLHTVTFPRSQVFPNVVSLHVEATFLATMF